MKVMKSGINPGRTTRKSVETGRPTNIRRSAEMGKPWNTLNKLSSTFTYVTRNHVQRTLFPMGAIPPTQRFSAAGFSPWPAHRGNKKGQLGVVKSGGGINGYHASLYISINRCGDFTAKRDEFRDVE
jgi:hypothetical protein